AVLMRDFDGDGRADFAASAPFYRASASASTGGRVLLWSGASADGSPPSLTLLAPPGALEFGRAMAALGLHGAGDSDLAGAARGTIGNPGLVFVYFGGPGADAKPDLVIRGELESDDFGAAIADAGDLNGDGVHDLAVGAPGYDGDRGRVQVYLGGPH